MSVPNTFASATSSIPLANLDANFAYYDAAFAISGSAVTFAGSITLTTGTANGVPYLNASKVLTTGSALTFNGTDFSATGTTTVNSANSTSVALVVKGETGNGIRQRFIGQAASGQYNWQIGASVTVAGNFEIIPSTAVDGTTFSTPVGKFSTTGLAVTGTLSATGITTLSAATTPLLLSGAGSSSTTLPSNYAIRINAGVTAANYGGIFFDGSTAYDSFFGRVPTALSGINDGVGYVTYASGAPTLRTLFSSTGLAVTGTLSATGTLSGGTSGTGYSFSGSAPATSLTLNSSGNLGLGVTPSAFGSTYKAFQPTGYAAYVGDSYNGRAEILNNAYASNINVFNYYDTNSAGRYSLQLGVHAWFQAPSGTAGNAITFTQAMTLDASGSLGIGTTSPASKLEVVAGTGYVSTATFRTGDATAANNAGGGFYATSSATAGSRNARLWLDADGANFSGADYFFIDKLGNSGQVDLVQQSAAAMTFQTSGTERARIDSSGSLLLKKASNETAATAQFSIAGSGYEAYHWLDATAYYIGQNSSIRSLRIYSDSYTAGVNLASGGTSWGTFSDERLKYDVEPITNGLDKLNSIRCVSYRLKDVDASDSQKKLGVIAQDLVGVVDEVIDITKRHGDETDYMSVRYTELIPVLVKAIQEQQALITQLTARITALETA